MAAPADLHLGPLTTIFTAPAACNSITVSQAGPSSYAPYVYPRLFSSIAASCFPSAYPLGGAAFSSVFGAYGYQDQHVYYSPGVCPSGWSVNIAGTADGETTAFCCQPGFHAQTSPAINPPGGISTLCTSSISSTVITTVAYTGDGKEAGPTQTLTFQGNNIPAGAIWIRYRDSDFAVSTTTSSQTPRSTSSPSKGDSLSKSTGTTTFVGNTLEPISHPTSSFDQQTLSAGLTPTSDPNTPTPVPTSSSGISTGAKIGLGVGIPVAILALAILAFVLFRKRKQRRSLEASGLESANSVPDVKGPAELSSGTVKRRSELPAGETRDKTTGRAELSGETPMASELGDGK